MVVDQTGTDNHGAAAGFCGGIECICKKNHDDK